MAEPNNVKSIFSAAAEKPAAERSAFLDQAVAGDTVLRARVEALLKAHDNPDSFLNDAAAEFGATIDLSPRETPLAERPGTLIGPYKLLEQIGEGGMGVVYMAEQQAPVRRRVALKIIKPGMDTRQVIARFEAERQALALMDHSNIARVLDAGATDSGRPYFVMELVRGVPVTEYCDAHNLSIPKRLELFGQVCQAVQHAHQKGLIHRDIKPSNVLVSTQDDRPVAKVIDFGVAKAMQGPLTDRTLFTEFQHLVGTPAYMSPEQAGGSLDVDTRSDVYSLGVLLYELLAGSPPFDPKELRSKAFAEMQRIIREVEPPTPSTRLSALDDTLATVAAQRCVEPRRLAAMVRGELDWIVMKAMEKDRTRRYESPGSLARDIERYLRDEPVLACPPSVTYRLKKFVRRNKIAAAFVLLLVAAVAALAVSNVQTRRNERRAITETAKVKAVSDLLQEMLGSANPDSVKGAEYSVRQLLDDSSTRLGSELAGQPEVEAEIRATIGRAYWRLGVADKAELHLARALELRRQLFGPDHEKVAESLVDYAWNLAEQSRHAEAETNIREALRIYRARGTAAVQMIQAEWSLQRFLISLNRLDEAEEVAKEALQLAADSGGEYPDVANILHALADAKTEQGHYPEAEQTARQSVEMHRRLHGPDHPETAWGLTTLGQALWRQQKLPEAEAALREALAIFRQCYRGNHKSVDSAFAILKPVLEARGDKAGLEALSRQEIESETASTDYAILDILLKRARTQANLREWKELDAAFDMLVAFGKASLPDSNYKLADGCQQLAHVLRQNNQWEQAQRVHRHAILLREPLDNAPPSVRLAQSIDYNELGIALSNLGKQEEAIASYHKAIELKPDNFGNYRSLSLALWRLGKSDEALNAIRKAIDLQPKQGELYSRLGGFLIEQSKLDEGLAALDKAIALQPTDPNAYNELGSVLQDQGKHDEAIAAFRRAIDVQPTFLNAYFNTAFLYESQGKFDEAVAILRKAIEVRPDSLPSHNNLGDALYMQGKYEEAAATYRKAIVLMPEAGSIQLKLGLTLEALGKKEEAEAIWQNASKLGAGDAMSLNRIAWSLATAPEPGRRNPRRAAELAKKAMELEPQDGENWNTLGIAQYSAGEWQATIDSLQKAMDLRKGGDSTDWFFLAMAHWQLDHKDDARKQYNKAVEWMDKNTPKDVELLRFRAEAAELLGISEPAKSTDAASQP